MTTLYDDLINNFRYMLKLPIPISPLNFFNILRPLESQILENIKKLDKDDVRKRMRLPCKTLPKDEDEDSNYDIRTLYVYALPGLVTSSRSH